MRVEKRELPGVRLLSVTGELDAFTVPPLMGQAVGWTYDVPGIVLDVSEVTFFDSGAVRLVDVLTRACGERGAGFQVVAPPASCARVVLELVGMVEGLVHDDVEAACAAVTG